ncbi:hypothetical protein [Amycolatopsis saalfeldensis]|uniref:Uncharacterized protein n=1 Tax=Amycolatopsis saalfeldensis TaxID=394193 RepID=A0A1H8XNG0_9PSEU|nr:hypothetical protein [Amycolatopsis saalfeldensis]SEP41356.1 hypothetical protein SAMN04489732_108131 [Amycolatopsis saalfeldensis]
MTRRPGHPTPTDNDAARHRKRGIDEDARIDHDSTTTVEPTPETMDPEPAARETYAEQQARLNAEAVDRWAVIVVDWPPMTEEQIRALAVILNRIDARQNQQLTQQRPNG